MLRYAIPMLLLLASTLHAAPPGYFDRRLLLDGAGYVLDHRGLDSTEGTTWTAAIVPSDIVGLGICPADDPCIQVVPIVIDGVPYTTVEIEADWQVRRKAREDRDALLRLVMRAEALSSELQAVQADPDLSPATKSLLTADAQRELDATRAAIRASGGR